MPRRSTYGPDAQLPDELRNRLQHDDDLSKKIPKRWAAALKHFKVNDGEKDMHELLAEAVLMTYVPAFQVEKVTGRPKGNDQVMFMELIDEKILFHTDRDKRKPSNDAIAQEIYDELQPATLAMVFPSARYKAM